MSQYPSTTNTAMAAYMVERTGCKYELRKDESPQVQIILHLGINEFVGLRSEFYASDYFKRDCIRANIARAIREL